MLFLRPGETRFHCLNLGLGAVDLRSPRLVFSLGLLDPLSGVRQLIYLPFQPHRSSCLEPLVLALFETKGRWVTTAS